MFTLIKPLYDKDDDLVDKSLYVNFHFAVDDKEQKYICTWIDWVKQEDVWLFIPLRKEFENQEKISLYKMYRLANKIFKSTLNGDQYKEIFNDVKSFWEKDISINLS